MHQFAQTPEAGKKIMGKHGIGAINENENFSEISLRLPS